MLKSLEGKKIPSVKFRTRTNSEWKDVTTEELFANKKVVVFSLPGAFTPTCSSSHVPRYNELVPAFKKNGISDVICISVNDAFVMNAWKADQRADNITFLPDGNGEFSDKMGLLVDKADLGFGKRSWRYSMLVNNGVIEKMFIEPEKAGDPFEVSDGDTMLNYLNPKADKPKAVTIFTKPGCPFCAKAKAALTDAGYAYEEVSTGANGVTMKSVRALTGKLTVPQVFIDGKLIGGSEDLESFLSK